MKFIRSSFFPVIILLALFAMQACKAKKLVQKSAPPVVAETPAPPAPAPQPAPVQQPAPVVVQKPDYIFSNIQFEFNSGILKTDSYPILDKAAAEMKTDTTVKFILKGYASAEGTDAHNMELSIDRANAVKAYLTNSGVSTTQLTTQGFGESNPVADNTTEAGRILNRRVEMQKLN